MDPITGSIISGGAGIIGTYMQNQASSAQAQRQMDFQRDMSGSAHQREVQDLRAAGLNPILSALGAGASTPAGASGNMEGIGDAVSQGINTGIAIKQQKKEFEQKDAQIGNTKADTGNKILNNNLLAQEITNKREELKGKVLQNHVLLKTLPALIKKAQAEGDYSELNQIMGVINSGASSASQLINPFKGLFSPKIQLPGKPGNSDYYKKGGMK